MALIKCPECGKEISDKASVCVNCGYPVSEYVEELKIEEERKRVEQLETQQEEEKKKYARCKYCGVDAVGEDEYCESCGAYQFADSDKQEKTFSSEIRKTNYVEEKPKFWERWWFLVLMCLAIPPVGLCLLWITKKPKYAPARTTISVFLAMYAVVWCIAMFGESDTDSAPTQTDSTKIEEDQELKQEPEQNPEKQDSDEKKEDTEQEDSFLSDLCNVVDKKVAKKAYSILKKKIGFSELEYKDQLDETTNYEIVADGYYMVLTASDDVYRIFIPNSSYVFYEDGEVKMTASDFKSKTIDQSEMYSYYSIAQEIVESSLKNPKSADFPSAVMHPEEISMQKDGDIVAVKSYVDASNSFGATVRSKWMVEFKVLDLENYSYDVLYVNMDGETSGEYVELE